MNKIFEAILVRIVQFSTWRGILATLMSTGIFAFITPELADQLAEWFAKFCGLLVGAYGLYNIIRDERKKSKSPIQSQNGFVDGLFILAILFGVGLGGSGIVKQEGRGLKIDKEVVKSGKPVDYSKLNQ